MIYRLLILVVAALMAACKLGRADQTTPMVTATTFSIPTASATAAPTQTPAPTATSRPANTSVPVVVLPPTVVNCTPRNDWPTYTVQAGDTLFRIAQRVGSTVSALTAANCLANPERIEAGQVLRVPNAVSNPPTTDPGDPIRFYLIIPEDDGASGTPVGCGDSSVGISTDGRRSGVVTQDIRDSLNALFSVRTYDYGQSGFVNELYDDSLTVSDVRIEGDLVTVLLSGSLMGVGTCADARAQAQILHTIFQYPGFQRARVMIGETNLRQLFDQSGLQGPDAVYTRGEI